MKEAIDLINIELNALSDASRKQMSMELMQDAMNISLIDKPKCSLFIDFNGGEIKASQIGYFGPKIDPERIIEFIKKDVDYSLFCGQLGIYFRDMACLNNPTGGISAIIFCKECTNLNSNLEKDLKVLYI